MTPETQDRERLEVLVRERWHAPPRRIERIPAGLGQRRFYRVLLPVGTQPDRAVARVEPEPLDAAADPADPDMPAWLPEPPLEPVRSWLEAAGLPVPRSLLHSPELGIDLLEDLGDHTLADAPASERTPLYREACALVPKMQALEGTPATQPAFGRCFDAALVRTKSWKWIHWAIPGLLGRAAHPSEAAAISSGFDGIARLVADAPRRLAHRDFKAENLHRVRTAGCPERLVMIDVQGAFLAPPEYDLVCLLCDLQVDLSAEFIQARFDETRSRLVDRPDPATSRLRFDALALVRLCKDVAHVVHAGTRRGDRRRWHEIPRGLDLIDAAVDRLARARPEARSLRTVIQTLTRAARSTDSRGGGVVR